MIGLFEEWIHELKTRNRKRVRTNLSFLDSTHFEDMELEELPMIVDFPNPNKDCEGIKSTDIENSESSEVCECTNCITLPGITECGVCYDPLQGKIIHSCCICFNLMCKRCAFRLDSCAFCRSIMTLHRNQAVEKLLSKLVLPCKNTRFGCEVFLDADYRLRHESVCNFSLVECPEKKGCSDWMGLISEIKSHFKNVHNLEVVRKSCVRIGIQRFQKKAKSETGHQYSILLSHKDRLFYLKISIRKQILKLSYTHIGCIEKVSVKSILPKYKVSASIQSVCKLLKGSLHFEKYSYETQEARIKCKKLYPNGEYVEEENDRVVFNFTISEVKGS